MSASNAGDVKRVGSALIASLADFQPVAARSKSLILAIAAWVCILGSTEARAAAITTCTNTPSFFECTLFGGDFDQEFVSLVFLDIDEWGFSAQAFGLFNDTQVPGGKEIVVDIALQHNEGPHGEGLGFTEAEFQIWVTNGLPFPQAPQPFVFFDVRSAAHVQHLDIFTFEWSVQAAGTDFVSWDFTVTGEHIGVPEPSTLALFLIGLLGIGFVIRREMQLA